MLSDQLEFFRSSIDLNASLNDTSVILEWIKKRNEDISVNIQEVPFSKLDQWYTDSKTGNIHHKSGKFFTIEGVEIKADTGILQNWSQPIIHQPEVGYLGFLVKKINGVLHFLVQAKIEPGNVNNVQLSPTIQATRSNYMQVHKGKSPAYLEYFKDRKGKVLADQLQSEQGARFFRKRNRNIIIEIEDEIRLDEDFMWVTLGQLKELLKIDNIVNMDTRTVISSIGYGSYENEIIDLLDSFYPKTINGFSKEIFYSYINTSRAIYSLNEIYSWLTELKSTYELQVNLIPLNSVNEWKRDDLHIYHEEHKYFEVIAVDVTISSREVAKWSQPIVKPCQEGIVSFVVKKINEVLHFLVQAKLEVGNLDIVELAPTVQCITGSYHKGENEYEVPYLEYVLHASSEQIMYDVMLSEEGGRFYKNQNRNVIILAGEDFPEKTPPSYKWFTLNQLMLFMQHNNYVNIEARSLLSVLSLK